MFPNFKFCPGEDGPSQMALEDLAMFRAIPTCTVFYPSDGVSTERAVELAANTKVWFVVYTKWSKYSHLLFWQQKVNLLFFGSVFMLFSAFRVSVSSAPVDLTLQSSMMLERNLKLEKPK